MVIEWCHQVRDVLQKNSAKPLLEGLNPGPLVEVLFWKERRTDLFFIMEQVCLLRVYINDSDGDNAGDDDGGDIVMMVMM